VECNISKLLATTIQAFLLCYVGFAAATNDGKSSETAVDMWQEPRHQLVFQTENVRLAAVNIPPGDTSLWHKHEYATAYIVIQDAELGNRVDSTPVVKPSPRTMRKPGTVSDRADYVNKPFAHLVKNYDDRAFKLLGVVNMNSGHSDLVSPGKGEAPLDNDWFREHHLLLPAGETSKKLNYQNDAVVVQADHGKSNLLLAVDTNENIPSGHKSQPGAWSWHLAGQDFKLKNKSQGQLHFVIIELKQ